MRHVWWSGIAAGLLLIPTLACAEQVEIVTYYPSPSTTTDDLRVKRATVGSGYQASKLNLDDELAKIPDGSLLVEGAVGIGTTKLAGPAPNGKAGNLTVNDVFLTSANAWASQALAADLAPTKPFTVTVLLPMAQERSTYAYDLYAMLQLWRYGVTREQMRLLDYNFVYMDIVGSSTGQYARFQRQKLIPTYAVVLSNGVLYLDSGYLTQRRNGQIVYPPDVFSLEITVDWPPYAP